MTDSTGVSQDQALPVGSVDQILNAPSDLIEETLSVPEWGCSVKVRTFSAAKAAQIKQVSLDVSAKGADVAWAAMERAQFKAGVIEPKFTDKQVTELHLKSGSGFRRVIDWLDEHNGMNKEELRKAQEEFPQQEE